MKAAQFGIRCARNHGKHDHTLVYLLHKMSSSGLLSICIDNNWYVYSPSFTSWGVLVSGAFWGLFSSEYLNWGQSVDCFSAAVVLTTSWSSCVGCLKVLLRWQLHMRLQSMFWFQKMDQGMHTKKYTCSTHGQRACSSLVFCDAIILCHQLLWRFAARPLRPPILCLCFAAQFPYYAVICIETNPTHQCSLLFFIMIGWAFTI